MNLQDLLIPYKSNTLYNKSKENIHLPITTITDYFDLQNIPFDVLLLGYSEDRNSENIGASKAPSEIREQLYNLYATSQQLKIVDLGDCIVGKTVKESYFVLQEVLKILKTFDKPIIIIGGTQEAGYYVAKEIFKKQDFPTFACIDSMIDIDVSTEDFSHVNFLQKISQIHSNTRIVHIANQEYLSHPKSFEWFKTNYFPLFRLGDIFTKRVLAEPLIRDAQVVSLDVSSIRFSDCPANKHSQPIGLYSEDACQLAWYSGYSPNMKVFLLSELNPIYDVQNISSKLASQIIWHIFDGISQRKPNSKDFSAANYTCYYVKNTFLDHDVRFFENFSSQQLWVEVPVKNKNKKRIIPCSYDDYQDFLQDNLPEFWLTEFNRVYQKQ